MRAKAENRAPKTVLRSLAVKNLDEKHLVDFLTRIISMHKVDDKKLGKVVKDDGYVYPFCNIGKEKPPRLLSNPGKTALSLVYYARQQARQYGGKKKRASEHGWTTGMVKSFNAGLDNGTFDHELYKLVFAAQQLKGGMKPTIEYLKNKLGNRTSWGKLSMLNKALPVLGKSLFCCS